MLLVPFMLSAVGVVHAATVHALVEVSDEGVRLIDAVTHTTDQRPSPQPPLAGAPLVVVADSSGQTLATAAIPDPRLRTIVLDPSAHGAHGAAVTLDRAIARVVLPWPAGAASVQLDGASKMPRAAPPGVAIPVLESGDAAERLDMVFLGDGYTADELDVFAADVDRMAAYMLSVEPYGAYSDLFNVWRVDTASAETGVSHFESGLSDARDTAYGCYYGCGGIDRLVCCNDSLVLSEVAESVPGADGVMVLINDPVYGGAGGYQYATSYTDGATGERVVVHELGHSLVGLGDEYSYGSTTGGEPRPNCTTDPDDPPWSAWLDDPMVDAFEVCGYTNHHRPTQDLCMMRSLRDDYCVVCRERAVLSVYQALPSIVASVDPPEGVIELPEDGATTFTAVTLGDDLDRFDAVWWLDGELLGPGLTATIDGCAANGTLTLSVRDSTPWVRSDPTGLLVDEAEWTLVGCEDGGDETDSDGADGTDGTGADDGVGLSPGPTQSPDDRACGCAAQAGGAAAAWWLAMGVVVAGRRREQLEPDSVALAHGTPDPLDAAPR